MTISSAKPNVRQRIITGLSTDTKPTEFIEAGTEFIETDTGTIYFYTGSSWIPKPIALGSDTFTVGNGGAFQDIDSALAYIATLTGMTQVAGTTGTVTATQYSEVVTGAGTNFQSIVQGGDLITISGDGDGGFITGGIYWPVFGDVISDTNLTIGMGFVGTTGAGKTYEIWRPEKYNLLLLPGTHTITAAVDLPNGINLNISGSGRYNTVLDTDVTAGSYTIGYDRAGKLTFSNLTIARTTAGGNPIIDKNSSIFVLDTTFGDFYFDNLYLDDIYDGAGNLFIARGCHISVSNIDGSTSGGLGNFASDGLFVNNLKFKAYTVQDIVVFSDNSLGSVTKPKVLDVISADREVAFTAGAGGIVEIQNINANRDIYASNLVLVDKDQGASSNPHCLVLQSGGGCNFYIRNSIIDPRNNAVGEGGIAGNTAGDNVYLMGTYGPAGAAVITEGAATFTTVY